MLSRAKTRFTIYHFCLQAEDDVGAMTRRIRLLEEDYEQTAVRLTTASGKLEEASKFAEESERCDMPLLCRAATVLSAKLHYTDTGYQSM